MKDSSGKTSQQITPAVGRSLRVKSPEGSTSPRRKRSPGGCTSPKRRSTMAVLFLSMVSAGLLLSCPPYSSKAAADGCVVVGNEVTCTGNRSQGIASGIDFTTPPVATLRAPSGSITPGFGASGISFNNSAASAVNVITGSSGALNNPVITTQGDQAHPAPGISASSTGSPAGYNWLPALGVHVPSGPAGSGGPVSVENYGTITTTGADSHGIAAQNSIGTYSSDSVSSLSSFSMSQVDISLTSVAGNSANIGASVAGDAGGSFTLNNTGTVTFVRGNLGDNLQPGQSIVTKVSYRVQIVHDPSGLPYGSQFSDGAVAAKIANENGTIVVKPLEIFFSEFAISGAASGASPLWPNLQGYVDRLRGAMGIGGAGESVLVTNGGTITTSGTRAHGISAKSAGGAGSTGSEGGLFDGPAGVGGTGSAGGNVTVTANGAITTLGDESAGVAALSSGGAGGTGGDGGWGGWRWGGTGGQGGNGGNVYVYGGGVINTGNTATGKGDKSSGIIALSEGGNGGNGGEGHQSMPGGGGGYGGKGGSVTVDGSWQITTRGDWAHGIWAKSVGGNAGNGGSAGWMGIGGGGAGGQAADGGGVTVASAGRITTGGDDSYGIFAQSVGGFGGSGGDGGYLFLSNNGNGNSAGSGGSVHATNETLGSITTHGDRAHGIYAQSIGGGGGAGVGGGALFVSLGGNGGSGGNGGAVTVANNGSIRTYGTTARGIYAQSIGSGGGSGGGSGALTVSIGGDGSAAGNGGSVTVTNTGRIETGTFEPGINDPGPIEPGTVIEGGSSAIHAASTGGGGGSGGGSGGVVSIGGNGSSAGSGGEVTVTNSGTLITWADFSRGILAQSVGGGGGDGAGSGGIVSLGGHASAVDTDGDGVVDPNNGGRITVTGNSTSSITTHGDYSDGIYAQSIGGGGGTGAGSGGVVSLGGDGSGGGSGDAITVTNSGSIRTEGHRSRGIFAQSVGGGGGDGAGSGGIMSFGGSGSTTGNGGDVTVANTGRIETGAFEPGTGNPGVIAPGTVIEGISSAIHAQSIGGGGGSGAGSGGLLFSVGGDGAAAGNGGVVSVTNSGTLITWADFSRGILAQSIGGGGGDGVDSGGLISMGGSTGEDTDGDHVVDIGGGNGGNVTVTNGIGGNITTHGDYSDGIYVQSIGGGGGSGGSSGGFGAIGGNSSRGGSGGIVTVTNNGAIRTEGYRSRGIFAESIGGGGGDAGGGSGVFTWGGWAQSNDDAGNVTVTNRGTIETMEGNSSGIYVQSIGGGGGSGGTARSYTAGANIGISEAVGGRGGAGGKGGTVTIGNESSITTHGASSHGVFAQSVGGGGGGGGESISFSLVGAVIPEVPIAVNSSLSIGGNGGGGGDGGIVAITNSGNISTGGFRSYGILAQSVGGGGGDGGSSTSINLSINCNITTNQAIGGNGAGAGDGNTVNVDSSGTITTQGDHAVGILAQSVGGGGGAGGDSTTVNVDIGFPMSPEDFIPSPTLSASQSLGGRGGIAGIGEEVVVNSGSSITTSGSFAHGILAQSIGGGGGAGGDARTFAIDLTANPTDFIPFVDLISYSSTYTLGGTGGAGGEGKSVTVTSNGAITTQGASAHGILAQSVGGGGGAGGSAVTFDFSTTDLTSVDDIPILGSMVNLTNIEATLDGGAGSAGNGGAVTVSNSGTISTQGAASHGILAQSIGGGGGFIAIYNPHGVTTTNFGANAQGILTQASGMGATFAGSLGGAGSGTNVNVTHSGNITTSGQGSHGIFAQSAGGFGAGNVTVTVGGNIIAQGVDSHGILAQSKGGAGNGNISVTVLSGTVQGGTRSGAGVYLRDGTNNTLTNYGTITSVEGVSGMAILASGCNETINNFGTVTGKVSLGEEGNHAFNNRSGATFNTGPAVNIGTHNTLLNEGTISPGGLGSFQTTTLTGNFVQPRSGLFQMQVAANGAHDKMLLSGSASLDGTLSVTKSPGLYRNGTVYELVRTTGNGGFSGTFSTILLPEPAPLLSFGAHQQQNGVDVETYASKFTTIATNGIEQAIADYLDRLSATADGDLLNVLAELQSLPASSFKSALTSLSPGSFDDFTRASFDGPRQSIGSLTRRMDSVRSYSLLNGGTNSEPVMLAFNGSNSELRPLFANNQLSQTQTKSGLWLNGYTQWGDQGEKQGFSGFGYRLFGATLGYDRPFSDNLMAGLSIGYSRTKIDIDDNQGDGTIKTVTGSLYGSYSAGNGYVEGAVSYGKSRYDNRRAITVGQLLRTAESDHRGDVFSGYLGGGYYYKLGGWNVGPIGSLRYVYLDEDGFVESGAGSLNMAVDSNRTASLVSELGLRAARPFHTAKGAFVPELSAAFSYDFDIDDRVITTSFAGSPGAEFSTRGQEAEKYGLVVGIGFSYIHKSGFSTHIKYAGEFREKYDSHGIIGQIRIPF